MGDMYIESVAVDRPKQGSWWPIPIAVFMLMVAWSFYYSALKPLPEASDGYIAAARASRYARMGCSLFFSMIGLWLIALRIRDAFGIPAAQRAGSRAFVITRNLLTAVFLFVLLAGLNEPVASPHGYSDDRLVMGAAAGLVWLAFAVDLVPLMRRALRALGARASALSFKRSTVGGADTGRVRIEGTIALAERGPAGSPLALALAKTACTSLQETASSTVDW